MTSRLRYSTDPEPSKDFQSLNPTEKSTAIHRLEERSLPLSYFRALLCFAQGAGFGGGVGRSEKGSSKGYSRVRCVFFGYVGFGWFAVWLNSSTCLFVWL